MKTCKNYFDPIVNICPKCGRHLRFSDIVYIPDFSSKIDSCEECADDSVFDFCFPYTVAEVNQFPFNSIIDYMIDDAKE